MNLKKILMVLVVFIFTACSMDNILGVNDDENNEIPNKDKNTETNFSKISAYEFLGSAKEISDYNPVSYKGNLYFIIENNLACYDGSSIKIIAKDSIKAKSLVVYKGKIYFNGKDINTENGYELYSYDGENVKLISDIMPNENKLETEDKTSSNPSRFTVVEDRLYFTAFTINNSSTDIEAIEELYVYDGNTVNVLAIFRGSSRNILETSNPRGLIEIDNKLYFGATNGIEKHFTTHDGEWLQRLEQDYYFVKLLPHKEKIYAIDDLGRLFEYSESKLIRLSTEMNFESMAILNDELYILSNKGSFYDLYLYNADINQFELKKTLDVKNISNMISYNHKIYFGADFDDGTGDELYTFDGNNIKLFKNLNTNSESSNPSCFSIIDGSLYFTANDGQTRCLYKYTDDSSENTAKNYIGTWQGIVSSKYVFEYKFTENSFELSVNGINGEDLPQNIVTQTAGKLEIKENTMILTTTQEKGKDLSESDFYKDTFEWNVEDNKLILKNSEETNIFLKI